MGANRGMGYPQRPMGRSDGLRFNPQTIGAISWGEAMHLWREAMRLRVIPWGEAIENY
jgi:hypothetical protein